MEVLIFKIIPFFNQGIFRYIIKYLNSEIFQLPSGWMLSDQGCGFVLSLLFARAFVCRDHLML